MKLNYAIVVDGRGLPIIALFWTTGFAQKLFGDQIQKAIAHYKQLGYTLVERSPFDAPITPEAPKARAPRPLKGAQQVLVSAQ